MWLWDVQAAEQTPTTASGGLQGTREAIALRTDHCYHRPSAGRGLYLPAVFYLPQSLMTFALFRSPQIMLPTSLSDVIRIKATVSAIR